MPTFMAVHKWKPQDEIAIRKELVRAFAAPGAVPKDVKLDASYEGAKGGAFCVWEAPSKEVLEKAFEKSAPILKKCTQFVPVRQMYPPTMEYVVSLWQQMLKAASK